MLQAPSRLSPGRGEQAPSGLAATGLTQLLSAPAPHPGSLIEYLRPTRWQKAACWPWRTEALNADTFSALSVCVV